MKEAAWYTATHDNAVLCELCPHHCRIQPGKNGICLTRGNRGGTLHSLNYCRPVSTALDPIEKKPLYHFLPGSSIYSTGPNGCTFKCAFCQNCDISQQPRHIPEVSPNALVDQVVQSASAGIAYTYSEPFIWFETIMAVGARIKASGLANVMVSNGFYNPQPLNDLLSVVDAFNIDIKSMQESFYRRLCKASLGPVLQACEAIKKKRHLEITNLLITDENDSADEVRQLARYIAHNLGGDTPLHISRYFPRYNLTHRATAQKTLLDAWTCAREHLDFVYIGNMPAGDKANTHCPACNELLIMRNGYVTKCKFSKISESHNSEKAICPQCKADVSIVIGIS
ncbi:MAG: AmmeMemoRadiSam system radical SAM enzyme [Chitinivibrionales bacterium]|nr:AmmeMemoRadiSam system radical SAM enzyme [Chitinivibrionales bacterium]